MEAIGFNKEKLSTSKTFKIAYPGTPFLVAFIDEAIWKEAS